MTDRPTHFALTQMHDGILVANILLPEISDTETAYAFRDEIIAYLGKHPVSHIVFNTGQVKFIGSVGFLAFLGVRRQLPKGRIVICNMAQGIREMFEVCRLISQQGATKAGPFEAANTLTDALEMLRG